jgi:transcription-repair coupling factor (superfamily II helicase)
MASSGLKDLSQMSSPPNGRKEVRVSVGVENPSLIVNAIKEELKRGGQVFVVVPFIKDINPTRDKLNDLLPEVKIIDAHGQHDDLELRIDAFIAGKADILLATTVIENGVDMPNVNTIIILQADRSVVRVTYLPTYLPTHLLTYSPTHLLTYLPTYLPTYINTYI